MATDNAPPQVSRQKSLHNHEEAIAHIIERDPFCRYVVFVGVGDPFFHADHR